MEMDHEATELGGQPVHIQPMSKLPKWKYEGQRQVEIGNHPPPLSPEDCVTSLVDPHLAESMESIQLGTYQRLLVSNASTKLGRQYFDFGLRLMYSFQHELAAQYFAACIQECPYTVLAHGLISLCHGPNYNFQGSVYYESTYNVLDAQLQDSQCVFPSQLVANRHSIAAATKLMEIKQLLDTKDDSAQNFQPHTPEVISDTEEQFLNAIKLLTCMPGIDPTNSYECVGRPYANAMKDVYHNYPDDPDIAYFYVESLMVLNAWQLYDYPSTETLSPDVDEIKHVLERSLIVHPNHPGLCHMYIHLCEMSPHPEIASSACEILRIAVPHGGHLVHMPTHIDVLLGDYDKCVASNLKAIDADMKLMETYPLTSGRESFYFNYIVHDFHMAVYGAILGGMERIAMDVSKQLNTLVNERMFQEYPNLINFLEAYSAMDVHVMVRFGRWEQILELELPTDMNLMLYRASSILYGRALAYAMIGNLVDAIKNADRYDQLRNNHPDISGRILYNNSVQSLLQVDSVMMHGEIEYRKGNYIEGLQLLRQAVDMQDHLNYDEPWGKMQPIRHALGGLLLEQGHLDEAELVFRKDLQLHPRNPWALVGLIRCLDLKQTSCCCDTSGSEILQFKEQLRLQRKMRFADYTIVVPCECCRHPTETSR